MSMDMTSRNGRARTQLSLGLSLFLLPLVACECDSDIVTLIFTQPLNDAQIGPIDDEDPNVDGIQFTIIVGSTGLAAGEDVTVYAGEVGESMQLVAELTQDAADPNVHTAQVTLAAGAYTLFACARDCSVRTPGTIDITVSDDCAQVTYLSPGPPNDAPVTLRPTDDQDGIACGEIFETTVHVATDAPNGGQATLIVNGTPWGTTATITNGFALWTGVNLSNRGETPNELQVIVTNAEGVTCTNSGHYPQSLFVDCAGSSCTISSPSTMSMYLNQSHDEDTDTAGLQSTFEVTTDADAVSPVELFLDGDLLNPRTAAPMMVGDDYLATFVGITWNEGAHTAQARCLDDNGNVTLSSQASWTVDLTACTVEITSHSDNELIRKVDDQDTGTTAIDITVSGTVDGDECTLVEMGGVATGECDATSTLSAGTLPTATTFTGSAALLSDRNQDLCARITDVAGNTSTDAVPIVVETGVDTIDFINPVGQPATDPAYALIPNPPGRRATQQATFRWTSVAPAEGGMWDKYIIGCILLEEGQTAERNMMGMESPYQIDTEGEWATAQKWNDMGNPIGGMPVPDTGGTIQSVTLDGFAPNGVEGGGGGAAPREWVCVIRGSTADETLLSSIIGTGSANRAVNAIVYEDQIGTNNFYQQEAIDTTLTESGYDIQPLGDVNGDGVDDFIVGGGNAGATFGGADVAPGRAYLFFGSTDLAELDDADAIFTNVGTDLLTPRGATVAGIGDFDGDGFNDFAISGNNDAGSNRVIVVYGQMAGWPADPDVDVIDASDDCATPGAGWQGLVPFCIEVPDIPGEWFNQFGMAIAGLDFDADGAMDLAVSDDNFDLDAGGYLNGAVFVLRGGGADGDGIEGSPDALDDRLTGVYTIARDAAAADPSIADTTPDLEGWIIPAPAGVRHLGSQRNLIAVGNVTGDAGQELIVGAGQGASTGFGEVYIATGMAFNTTTPDLDVFGAPTLLDDADDAGDSLADDGRFGSEGVDGFWPNALLALGDIDGDGDIDFGAAYDGANAEFNSRLIVYTQDGGSFTEAGILEGLGASPYGDFSGHGYHPVFVRAGHACEYDDGIVGDFTADGISDYVMANPDSGNTVNGGLGIVPGVSPFASQSRGSELPNNVLFWYETTTGTNVWPGVGIIGDVNDDCLVDIFVGSPGADTGVIIY